MLAGTLVVNLEAKTSQFTAGMERARRTNQMFAGSTSGATIHVGKLRGSLNTLALSLAGATGVNGQLGRFASIASSLAFGTGPVVALTAVVTIAAFAYDKMTKAAREAAEATKKFAAEQVKAAKIRNDPNAETRDGLTAAEKQLKVLEASLRARKAYTEMLQRAGLRDPKSESLAADIEQTRAGIAASKENLVAGSVAVVQALAREVAALKLGEDAVKRLELANSILDPSLRKAALAFHDQRVALEKQKKAHEEAAKAADEHTKAMERLLEEQHKWRVTNAKGGGNFTQGMGGTGLPVPVGGLLAGPSADQITDSRSRRIMDRMAQDAELYRQTWENAIRGVQDSFADMFEQIGRDGFRLVSVLENAAKAIQRAFAEMAAAWLTRSIVSAVFPGGGPAAQRGNGTQMSPLRAPAGPSFHMVQNVVFNSGFVDGGSGDAWLQAKKGQIAGIVAQAASEAPHFAQYLVAQGSRR